MRIFIVGGSGAPGRALIPLLNAAGHEVTATTRSAARAESVSQLGAALVVVDALNRAAVLHTVDQVTPEAIVHLLTDLSTGDSASSARLRTLGTRNLVDAARQVGAARMVAESISWVYPPGTPPAGKADSLDPDLAPSLGRRPSPR